MGMIWIDEWMMATMMMMTWVWGFYEVHDGDEIYGTKWDDHGRWHNCIHWLFSRVRSLLLVARRDVMFQTA